MASSLSQGAAALVIDATAASFEKKESPESANYRGERKEEQKGSGISTDNIA